MGRAGWTATIIGALVAAGVAVIVFMPRSLPRYVKLQAAGSERTLRAAETQQRLYEKRLAQLVASDPAYLAGRPEVRRLKRDLAARAAELDKARADQTRLAAIVARDEYEDSTAAHRLATKISGARERAGIMTVRLLHPVEEALRYKKEAPVLAARAAAAIARVKHLPSKSLRSAAAAARGTYPQLGLELDQRVDACERLKARVGETLAQYRLASAAAGADPVTCGRLAEAVGLRCQALEQAEQQLLTEIGDLGHHVDKVLIDIKTARGLRYHRYKLVRDRSAAKTDWQPVKRLLYQAHLDDLGMTIWSKPEGVLGSQASTLVAPPGYAYVGKPRYGAWSGPGAAAEASPSSTPSASTGASGTTAPTAAERAKQVWRFNETYAYMPALFWGKGYKPVTYADYLSYRTAATIKKPYYGDRSQYGTHGSWTKTHYAGSAYLLLLATRRTRYGSSHGSSYGGRRYRSSYGSRRYGSRRYGNRFGRSSYGGYGK